MKNKFKIGDRVRWNGIFDFPAPSGVRLNYVLLGIDAGEIYTVAAINDFGSAVQLDEISYDPAGYYNNDIFDLVNEPSKINVKINY